MQLGDEDANLLLPLYLVVGSFAVALGWQLVVRRDGHDRELGPVAVPLAAFVAWTGLTLVWSVDLREGAIFVGAFVLPFGLLALGFARLPWRGRWLTWLWVALVGTALAYASIGVYQWGTRDVFWNPKVIVGNAYAPFFRVNSIFWDPSIYGRYLTIGILTALAGILLGGVRGWKLAGLYAVVVAMWVGLFFSFSQSSFVALAVGVLVAALVVWGRIALLATVVVAVVRPRRVARRAPGATPVRVEIPLGARLDHERPRDARRPGPPHHRLASRRRGRSGRVQACLRRPDGAPGEAAEESRVAHDTGDRGRGGGAARSRSLRLAVRRGDARGPARARPGLHIARVVRRWPYASGDHRAQLLLQRSLRGPDDLGHARARRACGQRAAQGGTAVIEAWRRALVLAPHTDDGEFGCGGTTARLVEAGCEVRYVAFSIATRSLPPGFPPDTLAREVREATAELGIPESHLTVHDFDVRTFPDRRQDILELLVALWEEWQPDVVFQPSHHDVHQDHQTIAQEGLRAFKRTTILGYEIPWNNFDFSYGAYIALEQRHLERKVAAVERYASQQHRRYANAEYIWNLAKVHGTNVNRELAEVFQVYRIVA